MLTKCKCCANIPDGVERFKSNTIEETFRIRTHITCASNYVIHLLECPCGLQYIGRTTQILRTRINNYKWNVTNGYIKHSVSHHALHLHNCDFTKFCIIPIAQIPTSISGRFQRLRRRENFWIYKLNCLSPDGLNKAIEFNL